jgi:tRNA-uridine 2-sulfurtransferase
VAPIAFAQSIICPMSRNGKIIVAMSGGVDSSVAACLLREQGYECVGVFMRVGAAAAHAEVTCPTGSPAASDDAPRRRLRHGCCSASDALDARAVAGRLGIPFYALNFEAEFDRIIENFVDEYTRGRTPNPCVQCNIQLKFGRLLRYADMMEAPLIATGHYARVDCTHADGPRLLRAVNTAKDQSYVLFGMRRQDIGRCVFPLGEFGDKSEVRRIAADLGLRVHDKPDSQEICFVPNNDYRGLIESRRPGAMQPGEMVHASGAAIGRHAGVAAYTIGQRHGLGVALGYPAYVTKLDVLSNTVTIGPREALLAGGLIADDINWLADPREIDAGAELTVKIRHMHTPAAATAALDGSRLRVNFAEPQSAVTPGQAAVVYRGDAAVCGGWIREALS